MNPFSFKEFIRVKNKDSDMNTDSDETFYPMRKVTLHLVLSTKRQLIQLNIKVKYIVKEH